jgi:hypothetical protein
MRPPFVVFGMSALLVTIAFLLTLASAREYDSIFLAIMICVAIAIRGLLSTGQFGKWWLFMSALIGFVAVYSTVDVILRTYWRLRVLDLL